MSPKTAGATSSTKVVYAAAAGNVLIAITKGVAAAWTGSSAMLSEAVHSLVDTGNQGLLLYGIYRADLPPDGQHPLGHGRELYFWSFIVALLIFSAGAGVSFYEGILHLLHPTEITSPIINYAVLGLSFLFEVGSWSVAWWEFRVANGEENLWHAVTRSKDPPSFIVVFEDSAAIIGIVIATLANLAAEHWREPRFDGIGSVCIGILLGTTAVFLAKESKGLLIGERARRQVEQDISELAYRQSGVCEVNSVLTVHLAPDQVLAALSVEFQDSCTAPDIEKAVACLQSDVSKCHPEVTTIFVKPEPALTGFAELPGIEANGRQSER